VFILVWRHPQAHRLVYRVEIASFAECSGFHLDHHTGIVKRVGSFQIADGRDVSVLAPIPLSFYPDCRRSVWQHDPLIQTMPRGDRYLFDSFAAGRDCTIRASRILHQFVPSHIARLGNQPTLIVKYGNKKLFDDIEVVFYG
jgi:hypothetical protein